MKECIFYLSGYVLPFRNVHQLMGNITYFVSVVGKMHRISAQTKPK